MDLSQLPAEVRAEVLACPGYREFYSDMQYLRMAKEHGFEEEEIKVAAKRLEASSARVYQEIKKKKGTWSSMAYSYFIFSLKAAAVLAIFSAVLQIGAATLPVALGWTTLKEMADKVDPKRAPTMAGVLRLLASLVPGQTVEPGRTTTVSNGQQQWGGGYTKACDMGGTGSYMRLRKTGLSFSPEDHVPLRRLLRGYPPLLSLVEVENAGDGGCSWFMGTVEGFFPQFLLSVVLMVLLPTTERAYVGREFFGPILSPALDGDGGRALCPGFLDEIDNGGDDRRWVWNPDCEVPGFPPLLLAVRDDDGSLLRLWYVVLRWNGSASQQLCLLPRLSLLREKYPGAFEHHRRCWWHHLPRVLRLELVRINTVPMRELGMLRLL